MILLTRIHACRIHIPIVMLSALIIFGCAKKNPYDPQKTNEIFSREIAFCSSRFEKVGTIKSCAVKRTQKALAVNGYDDPNACIEKIGKFWLKQQVDIQEGRTTVSLSQKLLERFIAIIAKEC